MRQRRAISFVSALVLVAIGLQAGCTGPDTDDSDIVARVDGSDLRLAEYNREYNGYLLDTGLQDSPRRRRAFLDRLVGEKLLVADARQTGLSDSDAFRFFARKVEEKLLIDLYFQRTYFDSLQVRVSEMQRMLVRVNTLVKARHLYARSKRDADALYDRLQKGESFDVLARGVFHDPSLRDTGGLLGYIEFDEMDPDFEDATFELSVGETSEPVRTALGYSIIRVEDRFVKPIITKTNYAEKKDKLETYVRYRKESRIRRAVLEDLHKESAPVFDDVALSSLFDFISGGVISGAQKNDVAGDAATLMNRRLVSFTQDGVLRVWTVADFREVADLSSPKAREAVKQIDDLKTFISGLIVRDILSKKAQSLQIDSDLAFDEARSHNLDEWLYERAYNDAVATIPIPADTVRAYYDRYQDEFVLPERVEIREILVSSSEDARQVKKALTNDPFSKVAKKFSIRPGSDASGGYLGALTREQLGSISGLVFGGKENDIVGPVEVQDKIAFFHIGPRRASQLAGLDDVRTNIESLIRQKRKQGFLRNLVGSLRDRYTVELFPERLNPTVNVRHEQS